jgi:hypothetical protein
LKLQIIAFSSISTFQVRLPSGNNQTSLINLIIHIRDTLDCIAEYNMPSMIVASDSTLSSELMNNFRTSPNDIANNPIIQLLASGNQNTVGQIISSFSQEFNQMNNENIDKAVSSKSLFYLILSRNQIILDGISLTSISISGLGSQTSQEVIYSFSFKFYFFQNRFQCN